MGTSPVWRGTTRRAPRGRTMAHRARLLEHPRALGRRRAVVGEDVLDVAEPDRVGLQRASSAPARVDPRLGRRTFSTYERRTSRGCASIQRSSRLPVPSAAAFATALGASRIVRIGGHSSRDRATALHTVSSVRRAQLAVEGRVVAQRLHQVLHVHEVQRAGELVARLRWGERSAAVSSTQRVTNAQPGGLDLGVVAGRVVERAQEARRGRRTR